ncbi:copper homeostasis protein CutC [Pedobacter immunditicola]|uniref:copper homeostasis protein CutC n=1 Tax=Pedobacter immunditicola TaxID=3133440 RepID=UPI0030AA2AE5
MIQMEVCANSVASAIAAQEGGAIRVELCDNLQEGGTTPSYAQIKLAKELLKIKVYPIIRPRGGDFLYSELEFNLMKIDIQICKSLNCDGIVIGILKSDGSVDKERCAALIALASPMKVTFHRAFDSCIDMEKALEDIIEIGCERILSSGGKVTALEGAGRLKALIKLAAGRISIMPGAGVRENNVADIISITGATEFHATAKNFVNSEMRFKNTEVNMGSAADEYSFELTDANMVKSLIDKANVRS